MKIEKSNTYIIKKIIKTLEEMEKYKKDVRQYIDSLQSTSKGKKKGKRINHKFIIHFTDKKGVEGIIKDEKIKSHNGYISLTELSPFEFGTITKNKKYGFAFLKKEFIESNDIILPAYIIKKSKSYRNLVKNNKDLKKFIVEGSENEVNSIYFTHLMEFRCFNKINIDEAVLFFRNDDVFNKQPLFQEKGIFMLPYYSEWFSNYFINEQKWIIEYNEDSITIKDTRADKKLIDGKELIKKLNKIKSNNC